MAIIDWLYPKHCPVCLSVLPPGGTLICEECIPKIRRVSGPVCFKCGKPLSDETKEFCSDCARRMPPFASGIVYAEYSSKYVRRMLSEVKYRRNRQLLDYPCEDFARRSEETVKAWGAEALIPVPVHVSRLRERGYNQAEEIAERLGRIWKIPVDAHYLIRHEKTAAQKTLDDTARFMNLLHAFSVAGEEGCYRSVILVDDIYTTGSTLFACTKVLQEAGVPLVHTVVLAAGRDR